MNKTIILLLILCTLMACNDRYDSIEDFYPISGDASAPLNSVFEVSKDEVYFSPDGGEEVVGFSTKLEVKVSINEEHFQAKVDGNNIIIIAPPLPNGNSFGFAALLTIIDAKTDKILAQIGIHQLRALFSFSYPMNIEFKSAAGNGEIGVEANCTWTPEVINGANWIHITRYDKSSVFFTVDENNSIYTRVGYIQFTYPGGQQECSIYQYAN